MKHDPKRRSWIAMRRISIQNLPRHIQPAGGTHKVAIAIHPT
jgi:hypothetical protein